MSHQLKKTWGALALVGLLSACGGGDSAPAATTTTTTPPPVTTTSPGSLTVSAATNSTRNGVYATPTSRGSSTGTDVDINGQTADGKFELDVLFSASGTIKHAYVWFYTNAGATITFFGCNGGSIPCVSNQVSYDPLTKQINFSSAVFPEVASPFPGPATSVPSGESVTVSGAVNAN
ncbi:hypothetical protein BH11PSE7_BH11PSE7_10570 [soil metagenome]